MQPFAMLHAGVGPLPPSPPRRDGEGEPEDFTAEITEDAEKITTTNAEAMEAPEVRGGERPFELSGLCVLHVGSHYPVATGRGARAMMYLEEVDDEVRNKASTRRRRHVRLGLLRLGVPAALALAVLAMLSPGIASAHAYYTSSDPKAGQVVKQAPTQITVTFAENVNPQGSDIVVYDATRKQVSTAPAQVSRTNLKQMIVSMQGDGDGIYLVEWHTVSGDDGAQDIGGFDFMVNSSGTADASVGPLNPGNTTTTAASSGSGVPVWLTVVIGLVALVVGAGGGYFATRRAK